jgi:hypothetical protein
LSPIHVCHSAILHGSLLAVVLKTLRAAHEWQKPELVLSQHC